MRNKFLILIIFCIATIFTSCYEDKGNYDYSPENRISIEFDAPLKEVSIGDVIKVEPKLTMSDPTITLDDLEYRWTLNGKTREDWNQLNFEWITDEIIDAASLIFEVKKKGSNYSFLDKISIIVKGRYNFGNAWMILSEKNGESVLSILRITKTSDSPDYSHIYIDKAEVLQDVYKKENGTTAGTGPMKIIEHFCVANNIVGSFLLVQNSGSIDIDGTTIKKDIDLSTAFINETIPEGETIVDASYKKNTDVLVGKTGRLYSRIKTDNSLFNSGRYLEEPLKFENEILEGCKMILAPSSWNAGISLIHDVKEKRLLTIMDSNSEINALPGNTSSTPADFVPLNDLSDCTIFNIGYIRTMSIYFQDVYSMVLKKNGEYFNQTFSIMKEAFRDAKIDKIIGLTEDPTCVCSLPYHSQSPYLLIGVKNKLYIYDTSNPNRAIEPYLEFDGTIVGMNGEYYYGYHAMVALDNGKFFIIDTADAKNNKPDKRILYSSPEGLDIGSIKDIKRKVQSGW